MKKNLKFAILVVSLVLLCVYAVTCWVASATYQINLEKLVSTDEILYSKQFPSDTNETLFISADEENVIFRKIVDKYLWPFSNAKYPSIICQYTLCLDDLSKSIYSEGTQSVVIGDCSEAIENSIIIKDYYTIEDVEQEYVNNGVVSYLENRDDSRLMIAYDLAKKQELFSCPLSKDFILTRLQANSEYAICTEGYTRDAPLFLLNQTKDEFERITVDGCAFSVFSCHLFDKFIIINSNSTKNILLLSISDGSYYPYETKSNIIQSAVSPDGLFYGCNPAENLIFYLELSE